MQAGRICLIEMRLGELPSRLQACASSADERWHSSLSLIQDVRSGTPSGSATVSLSGYEGNGGAVRKEGGASSLPRTTRYCASCLLCGAVLVATVVSEMLRLHPSLFRGCNVQLFSVVAAALTPTAGRERGDSAYGGTAAQTSALYQVIPHEGRRFCSPTRVEIAASVIMPIVAHSLDLNAALLRYYVTGWSAATKPTLIPLTPLHQSQPSH